MISEYLPGELLQRVIEADADGWKEFLRRFQPSAKHPASYRNCSPLAVRGDVMFGGFRSVVLGLSVMAMS